MVLELSFDVKARAPMLAPRYGRPLSTSSPHESFPQGQGILGAKEVCQVGAHT